MRLSSLIRTVPAAFAAMCASITTKCLLYAPDQTILAQNGIPLGECRHTALSLAAADPQDTHNKQHFTPQIKI
jgi:hypothetical protein